MDEHSKSEELSLASDGALMDEQEVREAVKEHDDTSFPDKGETQDPAEVAEHLHHMPEGEVQYIDENGDRVV